MRQGARHARLAFSLLLLACGCAERGTHGPSPSLPEAIRKEARTERAARVRARSQQPGRTVTHASPTLPAPPAPLPSSAPPSTKALPDDAGVPSPLPAVPVAMEAVAAPAKETGEALCQQLCERTVDCAFEALDDAFGGADPGAAKELGAQREFGVSQCLRHCLERVGGGREALESCGELRDCDPLVECVGRVTVGDR